MEMKEQKPRVDVTNVADRLGVPREYFIVHGVIDDENNTTLNQAFDYDPRIGHHVNEDKQPVTHVVEFSALQAANEQIANLKLMLEMSDLFQNQIEVVFNNQNVCLSKAQVQYQLDRIKELEENKAHMRTSYIRLLVESNEKLTAKLERAKLTLEKYKNAAFEINGQIYKVGKPAEECLADLERE